MILQTIVKLRRPAARLRDPEEEVTVTGSANKSRGHFPPLGRMVYAILL